VTTAPVPARVVGFGEGALLTPANLLTLCRILATPVFLYVLLQRPTGWATWSAWFVLCATDLVDGRLARRHGVTKSGAFLDPLADKVLVLGCFAVLVSIDRVWIVPALLIAGREVAMSVYRSRVARRGISVPANKKAKAKTLVQCVAAGLTMFPATADHPLAYGAVVWLAVAFTLWTGLAYALEGRRLAAQPSLPHA
jgi:CDP-diacylglycerol--glycerol-3-phosphate 3-phosphatidyltransferase